MTVLCSYCSEPSEYFKDSSIVYFKNYGPIYYCATCDAWVGCHKDSDRPLGTLAKADLRALRSRVHALFDPLWLAMADSRADTSKKHCRTFWYHKLAAMMHIPEEECHVALFDTERCAQAIKLLKPLYSALPREVRMKYV